MPEATPQQINRAAEAAMGKFWTGCNSHEAWEEATAQTQERWRSIVRVALEEAEKPDLKPFVDQVIGRLL